jgi:hypothetical protein
MINSLRERTNELNRKIVGVLKIKGSARAVFC